MCGRILIIASYNGYRHETIISPAAMLQIQYQQLRTLKHSLDRVLVVVNEYQPTRQYDEEYESALNLFIDPMRIPNGPQGSYGAWRDAYLANPNFEWYFFLEDDYTFFMDNFDQRMIDMWTPQTTYLAERIGDRPPHAAISNGLIRGEALKQANWSKLESQGQYNPQVQVQWSQLFGVEGLRDITVKYGSPFYIARGSYNNTTETLPTLIGPVQML